MKANSTWIIGILAGLAGGLVMLAAVPKSYLAIILLACAPAAIYIASLGWGTLAGLIAAIVASAVSLHDGTWAAPLVSAAVLFLPAAWAGHLANLARRETVSDQGKTSEITVWFPLSGILIRLMLALLAGFIIAGWASEYSGKELAASYIEAMNEYVAELPQGEAPKPADIQLFANILAGIYPFVVPTAWLIFHVLVMHVSAVIVRRSGRLARPPEDIAINVNLPVEALVLPVAGIAGMILLSGPLYEISAAVAGIGIGGFALVGLAELHTISRGRAGRGFMLFISYLVLILFYFPMLVFAIIGARRAIRNRKPPLPPATTPGGAGTSH